MNRILRYGSGRFALAALLAVIGCGDERRGTVAMDIPFRTDGILEFLTPDSALVTRIAIEIAESDSAQMRGLMDRRSLPERGGMLFIKQDIDLRSFWMRSTPMPLDILFLDGEDRVVNVVRHTTPYSDEHIDSDGPARHVLEVRAGFTERWQIGPGTRIRWRRVDPTETN